MRADRRTGGPAGRRAGALLVLAATAGYPAGLEAQGGKAVGTPIEAITVNDLEGRPFDFGTVLGRKPVVVQFWATWCSVCEALEPAMRAAKAEFGDRAEFIGVNVTVNQSQSRVQRYIAEHSPPFRTLWDNRGVAVRAFEAPATGFVTIVGADGRVAYTGSGERQDIAGALRRIMK